MIRYHSLGLHGRWADVTHRVDAVTRLNAGWAACTGVVTDPATTHPRLLPALNPADSRLVPRALAARPTADR